jgi:hypothetical protein
MRARCRRSIPLRELPLLSISSNDDRVPGKLPPVGRGAAETLTLLALDATLNIIPATRQVLSPRAGSWACVSRSCVDFERSTLFLISTIPLPHPERKFNFPCRTQDGLEGSTQETPFRLLEALVQAIFFILSLPNNGSLNERSLSGALHRIRARRCLRDSLLPRPSCVCSPLRICSTAPHKGQDWLVECRSLSGSR